MHQQQINQAVVDEGARRNLSICSVPDCTTTQNSSAQLNSQDWTEHSSPYCHALHCPANVVSNEQAKLSVQLRHVAVPIFGLRHAD
jgi:hypothetical protein